MANHPLSTAIERLRLSMALPEEASLPDTQLLGRFIEQRDEAAFAALARRYGPMVMGVCLRVARNRQDAEDAFQATFLVLVRKAASIAARELLANWLYGVAYNTALKAKEAARKRRSREKQVAYMPEPATDGKKLWSDLLPLLDHELSRLPDKYRVPIILCDLEGKTHKEAARKLGCPDGSLSSRLSRARSMLAKRLGRHGLAVSGGTLATVLSQTAAPACVPAGVVFKTINGATLLAAGQAINSVIPARVALLTEGVMKAMLLAKLKIAAVTVLLTSLACVGVGAVTRVTLAEGKTQQFFATKANQKTAKPLHDAKGQLQPPKKAQNPEDDPLPPDALLRLGTLRHRFLGYPYQRLADGQTVILTSVTADEVRWVDFATGRTIDTWQLPKGLTACGFSDDGRFALITDSKTISLWDLPARKEIRAFQAKDDFGQEIFALFAHDGKVVATNHGVNMNAGLMRLWDVATGKQLWQKGRMGFHNIGVSPLGFLADGETLVVRDWSNNRISLRDRTTGKERRSFDTMPYGESRQLLLSPDAKTVFISTAGSTVRAWDVAGGEELAPLGGHKRQARSVAISHDCRTVLTGGDDSFIQVWDWPAGTLRRKIELPSGRTVGHMDVSFDGKRAEMVIFGESALRSFDLGSGQEIPPLTDAHRGQVWGVAITADGKVISAGTDNTIREWDCKTGRHLRAWKTAHPLGASTLALSADSKLIATADFNGGTILVHERESGRLIRSIDTKEDSVRQVAYAPKGRVLAVSGGGMGGRVNPPACLSSPFMMPIQGKKWAVWWDPSRDSYGTRMETYLRLSVKIRSVWWMFPKRAFGSNGRRTMVFESWHSPRTDEHWQRQTAKRSSFGNWPPPRCAAG
jgi:RNA polymerase sigma factor (sigma-70 family)